MARRVRANNDSKATRHKASPVEVRQVANRRLWQTAMKIAGNDASRIVVESPTKLTILIK